jgi:hypothetical protein
MRPVVLPVGKLGVLGELDGPLDTVRQVFQLHPMFSNNGGSGRGLTGVGEGQSSDEDPQVLSERLSSVLSVFGIVRGELAERILDLPPNLLPVEADLGVLILEKQPQAGIHPLLRVPQSLLRLNLGEEYEKDPLVDLAGRSGALAVDQDKLPTPASNVGHDDLRKNVVLIL